MTRRASIRVYIESLVVRGLGPLSREALRAAVQAELRRRLAADLTTAWDGPRHRGCVDGGPIAAPPGAGAADIGVAIATAVHRGLTTPSRSAPPGGAPQP